MNDHDHARLLLAIVQRHWDRATSLGHLARQDPDGFIEVVRQVDLLPWLHAQLTREKRADLIGPRAMERLDGWRKKIRHDNLLLLARAEQALDLLLDAGVVPIALKGLDLLQRLYRQFDERTMTDVDLLVRTRDLPAALGALRKGGWQLPPEPDCSHYIRGSHHLPLSSPGPIKVEFELHWNLAQEIRFSIDPELLFERAVPCEIAGRRVLRLHDHDVVAHLLLHHFTHYFDRQSKWAVDLHALTRDPGFAWDEVATRVREWDATIVCGFALLHLKKLVPDWIPDRILELLPVPGWRRALTSPLLSSHPLELYRNTRSRRVQLYLAAVMLERPTRLPGWLVHRALRDRTGGANPLEGVQGDADGESSDSEQASRTRRRTE